MDLDDFWKIIDDARGAGGDWTDVPDRVTDALAELPLAEIADFAQLQDELEWATYREDLLTACLLINAGFGSADSFLYFREWLLVQGRPAFEAALADPDSLIDVPGVAEMNPREDDVFADCEAFLSVARRAWRLATGTAKPTITIAANGLVTFDPNYVDWIAEELARRGYKTRRDRPLPLTGMPIDFDDPDAVAVALPRLSARFYEQSRWRG
jgi:hypothetical protein